MPLKTEGFPKTDHLSYANPYIQKLEEHPHLLLQQQQIWDYFAGKESLLEIGCGNGHFLAEYLLRNPQLVGLGVDRRFKRLFRTATKFGPDSKSKVFFGDAPSLVKNSPDGFWKEIWMQFPDPWPKDKHSQNRMLDENLFEQIFRSLKAGASFCFISDHKDYWLALQDWQNASQKFSNAEFVAGDLFHDLPSSLFKRSMLRHGVPVYSARLQKTA